MRGVKFTTLPGAKVLLLIGVDAPEAFWTFEKRRGTKGEPYAVRTSLGWYLISPASSHGNEQSFSINHVMVSNAMCDKQKSVNDFSCKVVGSVDETVGVINCMKSCDTASIVKNIDDFSCEVVDSVDETVCVNDCVKSCDTVIGTLTSIQHLRKLFCAVGYLFKWLGKGVRVREAISNCDRPDPDTTHTHTLGVAIDIVLREWWRLCRWRYFLAAGRRVTMDYKHWWQLSKP